MSSKGRSTGRRRPREAAAHRLDPDRGDRWRTEAHSTVNERDEEGGVYPSDHYAVPAELAPAVLSAMSLLGAVEIHPQL